MTEKPERTEAISNELRNLLALVEKVETGNYDGAMDELRARKEELLDIHEFLLAAIEEEDTINLEGEEVKEEEKKEEEKKEETKTEEKKEPEDPKEPTNAELKKKWTAAKDAYTKAKAAYKEALAAQVTADAGSDEAAKTEAATKVGAAKLAKTKAWDEWVATTKAAAKKNIGLIVFACIAGAAVVGAAVWYFCFRNKDSGEGGEAEARTLFKTQIKKNKPQKETLV